MQLAQLNFREAAGIIQKIFEPAVENCPWSNFKTVFNELLNSQSVKYSNKWQYK